MVEKFIQEMNGDPEMIAVLRARLEAELETATEKLEDAENDAYKNQAKTELTVAQEKIRMLDDLLSADRAAA